MCASTTGKAALKLPNPELKNVDDTRCDRHFIYIYGASSCLVCNLKYLLGFIFPGMYFFFTTHNNKGYNKIFTYIVMYSPICLY